MANLSREMVFNTKKFLIKPFLIAKFDCINYSANVLTIKTMGTGNCRENPQFLQPFSIDSADFPCRGLAISSPVVFMVKTFAMYLSRLFDCLVHLNLNATLVIDQK